VIRSMCGVGVVALALSAEAACAQSTGAELNDTQRLGRQLFNQSCRVCHTPPALNAPLYGPALDSQFEWVAHEPEALKQGVPQTVIDVIKHRGGTLGLDDTDAVVIELGRELWRDHRVSSQTFATAKALFGPHALIDLVLLMGNYAGTAALLAAVDMQLQAGKQPLLPIP